MWPWVVSAAHTKDSIPRGAGYSLSAILRMLNRLENRARDYEEIKK